jgi:RNA polymerase sigma factor (TIGR02999 family)
MNDVTRILSAIDRGDAHAAGQLLPLVYGELRKLAAAKLAAEKPGQTLQATALVHEAYLRLVGGEKAQHWESRRHFFAAAAEAMRRILVDRARRKARKRHGGGLDRRPLDPDRLAAPGPADDVLALDEALDRLAAEDPRRAELVKLRFFGGLTVAEAGRCLGLSRATADRDWAYARAWLYDRLRGGRPAG